MTVDARSRADQTARTRSRHKEVKPFNQSARVNFLCVPAVQCAYTPCRYSALFVLHLNHVHTSPQSTRNRAVRTSESAVLSVDACRLFLPGQQFQSFRNGGDGVSRHALRRIHGHVHRYRAAQRVPCSLPGKPANGEYLPNARAGKPARCRRQLPDTPDASRTTRCTPAGATFKAHHRSAAGHTELLLPHLTSATSWLSPKHACVWAAWLVVWRFYVLYFMD